MPRNFFVTWLEKRKKYFSIKLENIVYTPINFWTKSEMFSNHSTYMQVTNIKII